MDRQRRLAVVEELFRLRNAGKLIMVREDADIERPADVTAERERQELAEAAKKPGPAPGFPTIC